MENNNSVNRDLLSNIAEFSEKLLTVADFSKLADNTIEYIACTIKPVYISFLLFEGENYRLCIDKCSGQGVKRTVVPEIKECDQIDLAMAKGGHLLPNPNEDFSRFLVLFDKDQGEYCELCIPFYVTGQFIGIICLGKQQSGLDYSIEAVEFLHVLSNTVALVCQNIVNKSDNNKDTGIKPEKTVDENERKSFNRANIKNIGRNNGSEILGNSSEIVKVREMIEHVAGQEVPVLITGESGTGKELVAQAIHSKSKRSDKPLVALNCAAMPETLVESELFGHEKGAFTGAIAQKRGKFEHAHQSTLFLDEIGDMSLSIQAKLLRILQDGRYQRVGGNKSLYADVRLVAATNKNIVREIQKGQFRQDLYYRINVVQIEMPPLRKRGNDIVLLAEFYLYYYNLRYNRNINGFDDDVLEWMTQYDFPGNVRELKNLIERSVIMGKKSMIGMDSIPGGDLVGLSAADNNSTRSLEELEKEHILSVMKQVGYNKSAAARILGIARKTLREKILKYGITF
ncbi:sigma-54-dependent Fis family transcriptional regulator [candidate division KSB1 bacterium]|nr:sigma-54-dependent Fis family transcriptional regulator [candidate division KSB1 bacterium]